MPIVGEEIGLPLLQAERVRSKSGTQLLKRRSLIRLPTHLSGYAGTLWVIVARGVYE